MYFDYSMLLLLPAILLASYSQYKISKTYSMYSKVPSIKGYTGSQVARYILDKNGLSDIPVNRIEGELSDHYDPINREVRLSASIYDGDSIASISVAAHEVGHAIQHKQAYTPLTIRSILAPIASASSQFVWLLIMVGLFFQMTSMINIGIVVFSITVLFQIITLPVEFDASRRAIIQLQDNFITEEETKGAKSMLGAAAFTYVAATLVGIMQLLRLIFISRRRD